MLHLNKKSLQFRAGVTILAGMGMTMGVLSGFQGISLQLHIDERSHSPSATHIFGTDALGRDMLFLPCARHAAIPGHQFFSRRHRRHDWLRIGLFGRLARGLAQYWNYAHQRFHTGLPRHPAGSGLNRFLGPGSHQPRFALVFSGWVGYARLVRGEVLKIKEREFILAARGFNASSWQTARGHMLPLIFPLLLTQAVSGIAAVIMAESS